MAQAQALKPFLIQSSQRKRRLIPIMGNACHQGLPSEEGTAGDLFCHGDGCKCGPVGQYSTDESVTTWPVRHWLQVTSVPVEYPDLDHLDQCGNGTVTRPMLTQPGRMLRLRDCRSHRRMLPGGTKKSSS